MTIKKLHAGFDEVLAEIRRRGLLLVHDKTFPSLTRLTIGEPVRGSRISGIEDAAATPGVVVFHSGTREVDGVVFADGGRVLAITALGSSVAEARKRAYEAVDRIKWPDGFCRRDIGWRGIARESR